MTEQRIALVSGGNRGIGFEVCRQLSKKGLKVVLTARHPEKAEAAAASLAKQDLDIVSHQLDVTDPESVARVELFVRRQWRRLDVLINNAGFYHDPGSRNDIATVDLDFVRASMDINLYGPLRLCQAVLPLMKQRRYGRIVNVTSNMAQLAAMSGGWPAYRLSKTALNALTRVLADEVKDHNILVNSVSPGWVRTQMGGPSARLSVEQGADTIAWLATLPDDGPTGGFFAERRPINW